MTKARGYVLPGGEVEKGGERVMRGEKHESKIL